MIQFLKAKLLLYVIDTCTARLERTKFHLTWNSFFLKIDLYTYAKGRECWCLYSVNGFVYFHKGGKKAWHYYIFLIFLLVFFFNPKNGISFILCCLHY